MIKYLEFIQKFPIIGVSTFVTIIPILIILFRSETKKPLWIFFCYLVCQLIADLIGLHYSCMPENSLWICNIMFLVGFVLMACIFKSLFVNERTCLVIDCITFVYCVAFVCDLMYSNPNLSDLHNHKYMIVIPTLYSFLIILFCLLFYLELLEEIYIEDLPRSDIFWLIGSIFIYNCVSIFATSFYHFYMVWESDMSLSTITDIPYIAYTFSMIMFSIGLLISREQKNNPTIKNS